MTNEGKKEPIRFTVVDVLHFSLASFFAGCALVLSLLPTLKQIQLSLLQ